MNTEDKELDLATIQLRIADITGSPSSYREDDALEFLEDDARGLCAEVTRLRDQLTSERERGAKADALMLEKVHGLERQLVGERESIIRFLQDNMGQMPRLFLFEAIRRGEASK